MLLMYGKYRIYFTTARVCDGYHSFNIIITKYKSDFRASLDALYRNGLGQVSSKCLLNGHSSYFEVTGGDFLSLSTIILCNRKIVRIV